MWANLALFRIESGLFITSEVTPSSELRFDATPSAQAASPLLYQWDCLPNHGGALSLVLSEVNFDLVTVALGKPYRKEGLLKLLVLQKFGE